jgi:hypothetical protein
MGVRVARMHSVIVPQQQGGALVEPSPLIWGLTIMAVVGLPLLEVPDA